MSCGSVCQVARSWVEMGSFHLRFSGEVYGFFFTASVRNILDTPSYAFTTPYDYVTMYQGVRCNTAGH
jgi:hypothetical protein